MKNALHRQRLRGRRAETVSSSPPASGRFIETERLCWRHSVETARRSMDE